jgi:DNA-binding transcriptional MerR regulator
MDSGYSGLSALIERTRREWKRSRVIEGILLLCAFVVCSLVLAFVLDNVLHLSFGVRLAVLAVFAVAWVAVFARRVAAPWIRRMSDEAVAVAIERKYPALDNRLINTVQLSNEELDAFGRFFARKVAEEAEMLSAGCEARVVAGRGRIRKFAVWTAAVLFVAGAYFALFPEYFTNAALRYALVAGDVPPLTDTKLFVEPGDADVPLGGTLVVRARVGGVMPDGATILTAGAGETSFKMAFDGAEFCHKMENITAPFSYSVTAGDAKTRMYRVRVIPLPVITAIRMETEYPGYMGRPKETSDKNTGDIEAPAGSVVNVFASASKDLAVVKYLGDGAETRLPASGRSFAVKVRVTGDSTYGFYLKDTDGRETLEPIRYKITALEDKPPAVEITAPGKDLSVSEAREIVVNFRAMDDFSIRSAELVANKKGGTGETVVKRWDDFPSPAVSVAQGCAWKPDAATGDEFTYYLRVWDGCSEPAHVVESRRFVLRVVAPEKAQGDLAGELAGLRERLLKLIALQKDAKTAAEAIIRAAERGVRGKPNKKMQQEYGDLKLKQAKVLADGLDIANSIKGSDEISALVRKELLALSADEMPRAVKLVDSLVKVQDPDERARTAGDLVGVQGLIIDRLTKLLAPLEAAIKKIEKALAAGEKLGDKDLAAPDEKAVLKKVAEGLKEFISRQKEIIETTRELEKKPMEDFTDADKAKLEEITSLEKDLGKFLEDLKDDLAQLPEQDMTDSSMAKELVEIYSEVEKAADALTKKKVEIAVPHEDAGLELAQDLENNLERWLPTTADYQKWVMEDPGTQQDTEVPLTDLPDELEDMIGDLMAEEEQLSEDAEDLSSKWMDSIDQGAGWEASDGPISNMSAKGVTGNQLPNSQEVGGRSGEGRTGRSSGQHVEETATGKGGRATPTRVTPDPYEKGQVKDSSKDDPGGATGGGKVSGGGEKGLFGQVPPELKGEMGRMSGKQADIRQKAERLAHGLGKLNYPAGDLGKVIILMKEQEDALKNMNLPAFQSKQKVLLETMKDAGNVVTTEARARSEKAASVPKYLREELMNAKSQDAPEGYRKLVGEYFRALSGEKDSAPPAGEKK